MIRVSRLGKITVFGKTAMTLIVIINMRSKGYRTLEAEGTQLGASGVRLFNKG
jgi:hypothetical protein